MTKPGLPVLLVAASLAAGTGCRGGTSRNPPVHLNPNMDQQHYFEAQEENPFFADRRAMRPQVAGTVARGELHEDDRLSRGRSGADYTTDIPVPVDKAFILRGQSRFDIYCAPCHDRAGTGQGLVARRGVKQGMIAPPDFHGSRVLSMPVGQIFDTISNGARGMPAYGRQIPERDRWAVVAWLRVLQASRRASLAQVPTDIAEQRGWTGAPPPPPGKPGAP